MNSKSFVCDHNPTLFQRFHERALAVRVAETDRVVDAAADVVASGNTLIRIIVESPLPLDRVAFREDWGNIPITLMCPSIGRFGNLVKRFELLRNLNLQIYLPWRKENLIGLQILASVGLPCGLGFADNEPDWDSLADLMTYSLLGRIPHAPIEPFAYIAENYKPFEYTDWGSVYFDDPAKFLHLETSGRVAMSNRELLDGYFVAQDVSEIDTPEVLAAITAKQNVWRQAFFSMSPCSVCQGWRVCLGRLAQHNGGTTGCSAFSGELMDVVEQFQTQAQEIIQAQKDGHHNF